MLGASWYGEWVALMFICGGAALLSLFYYGGLWLTLQHFFAAYSVEAATAWWRHPVLLVTLSFVARTALVVMGLALLTRGELLPLLVAMIAFVATRMLIIQRVGLPHIFL